MKKTATQIVDCSQALHLKRDYRSWQDMDEADAYALDAPQYITRGSHHAHDERGRRIAVAGASTRNRAY